MNGVAHRIQHNFWVACSISSCVYRSVCLPCPPPVSLVLYLDFVPCLSLPLVLPIYSHCRSIVFVFCIWVYSSVVISSCLSWCCCISFLFSFWFLIIIVYSSSDLEFRCFLFSLLQFLYTVVCLFRPKNLSLFYDRIHSQVRTFPYTQLRFLTALLVWLSAWDWSCKTVFSPTLISSQKRFSNWSHDRIFFSRISCTSFLFSSLEFPASFSLNFALKRDRL